MTPEECRGAGDPAPGIPGAFRRNLRAQLDNLVVIDEDGNRLSVKEANKNERSREQSMRDTYENC